MAHIEPTQLTGSNVLFHSLLNSLQQCCGGQGGEAMLSQIFQHWGRDLGSTLPWTGRLSQDLDLIAELLHTLNLVRVMEPYEAEDQSQQLLVMRCAITRQLTPSAAHRGQEMCAALIEGLLASAGHHYNLQPSGPLSPRVDEYVLLLEESTGSTAQAIKDKSLDFLFAEGESGEVGT